MKKIMMLLGLLPLWLAACCGAWQVSLDMDVDPWTDDPPWTGTTNVDPPYYGVRREAPEATTGYYWEIDTLANAGDVVYFEMGATHYTSDFEEGFMLETNLRWYNGTLPGSHSIVIHSAGQGWLALQPYYRYAGGAWHLGMRVYTNDVGGHALIDLQDIYAPQQDEGVWQPTPWITLSTIIENGVAGIYANDSLRLTVDMDNLTTANTYVRFGDQSSGAAGMVDYNYIRFGEIPEIEEVEFTAITVEAVVGLGFDSLEDTLYELDAATTLNPADWYFTGMSLVGDGTPMYLFDPVGYCPNKFYRIRIVSP